jgi:hypothetical protein
MRFETALGRLMPACWASAETAMAGAAMAAAMSTFLDTVSSLDMLMAAWTRAARV